jgi:phage repressor protein C with HTH and peptisase S24 domain
MLGKETASMSEKGEIKYFKAGTGEPFPADTKNLKATAVLTMYGFVDCQYAFDVFGDSMAPRFKSGDIVMCSDAAGKTIHVGEPYYMVISEGPLIRVIKANAGLTYKLSAENPRIDDYEVNVSEVSHIYQIKGLIRREAF